MKKLSTKHKIALVEIVIVILLAVWIFSPKSFQSAMGYDFDPAQVTAVTAVLSGDQEIHVDLDEADPAIGELMTLLESSRYRPQGDGGQPQERGLDYRVTLFLRQESKVYTITFSGGDQMDFRGSGEEGIRAFRPTEGLPFQQEILDLLLEQTQTAE